jgi:Na+-driven multidrug efflux pump
MLLLTCLCQIAPEWLVRAFTNDPRVIDQAALYLRIISWNFAATGTVFCCSGMFQALGNAWPGLISTGSRLFTFALPAIWLTLGPHFRIEDVWYLSVVSVALQAITSLLLMRRELRRRLPAPPDIAMQGRILIDTLERERVAY